MSVVRHSFGDCAVIGGMSFSRMAAIACWNCAGRRAKRGLVVASSLIRTGGDPVHRRHHPRCGLCSALVGHAHSCPIPRVLGGGRTSRLRSHATDALGYPCKASSVTDVAICDERSATAGERHGYSFGLGSQKIALLNLLPFSVPGSCRDCRGPLSSGLRQRCCESTGCLR